MNQALLRGSLYPSCRHTLRRSIFLITPASNLRHIFSTPVYSHAKPRAFSSITNLQSETPSNAPESHQLGPTEESAAPAPHIPWYLQEEPPTTESQPVSSRDHLPELPENPPAILPVLLEYTFKDLGLDELKLYDLRSLETPPALGANVIMLIGTARSVKHLNVAADRLCRWLRSTYKLSPYADGLLGRNELKIKLRRKARRVRAATQSGAIIDDKDDGITTGWICVNAGVVEEASVAAQQEAKDLGFEGFGSIRAGTRVVVQMFTEEKRAEVDLEGLWQGNLDRAARRNQTLYPEETNSTHTASDEVRAPSTTTNRPFSDRHVPRSSAVSMPLEQRRVLHTRPSNENGVSLRKEYRIHGTTPSGNRGILSTSSLFEYLSSLPDEQARHELGNGPDDRDSTLFLQLFHVRTPGLSAESAAMAKLQLMCVAVTLRHDGYSKERLWEEFKKYSHDYKITENLGLQIASAMLTKQHIDQTSSRLSDADKELGLRVLEQLSLQGTEVLSMKVLTTIYQAFSPEQPELVSQDSKEAQTLSAITKLLNTLDVPFDHSQARVLMPLLFRNHDYDGFWKLWRKLPLDGSPRTPVDYEKLFELHAELGDERRARDCLLTWAPMMAREDPPVALEGALLQHVMYCLVIADPEIEQTASQGSVGYLAQLWRECRGRMGVV